MEATATITDYDQFKATIAERGLQVKTYASKDKRHPGLKVKILTTDAVPCVIWDYQKPTQSLMEGAQTALNELEKSIANANVWRAREGKPLL